MDSLGLTSSHVDSLGFTSLARVTARTHARQETKRCPRWAQLSNLRHRRTQFHNMSLWHSLLPSAVHPKDSPASGPVKGTFTLELILALYSQGVRPNGPGVCVTLWVSNGRPQEGHALVVKCLKGMSYTSGGGLGAIGCGRPSVSHDAGALTHTHTHTAIVRSDKHVQKHTHTHTDTHLHTLIMHLRHQPM